MPVSACTRAVTRLCTAALPPPSQTTATPSTRGVSTVSTRPSAPPLPKSTWVELPSLSVSVA